MQKPNWKVLAGVLILTTGILGLVVFFFTSSKTRDDHPFPSTIIVDHPTATPAQQPSLKQFQSKLFSILYPNDWIPEEKDVYGGGSIFIIKPAQIGLPRTSIQVTPFHQNTLDTTQGIYEVLKFQKSNAVINGLSATKYTGTIKEMAETSYVFSYNNTAYQITFDDKNNTAQNNSRFFSQMLASFQLVR